MCATHKGFFCEGKECQTGYGMSFFSKSCDRCACKPDIQWSERKGAFRAAGKKKRAGKKGKKNKVSQEAAGDD